VPALLASLSIAASNAQAKQATVQAHQTRSTRYRWLIAAPNTAADLAAGWILSYSAHFPCMVYSLATGDQATGGKTAYQFKPEGSTVLDRFGVWVLNVLSSTVHGMMNPHQHVRLTTVKTAQRLAARFERFHHTEQAILVLSPSDLAAG
jgi:hypothetical protein